MSDSDKIKLTVLPTETMHADLTWLLINPANMATKDQPVKQKDWVELPPMSSSDNSGIALKSLLRSFTHAPQDVSRGNDDEWHELREILKSLRPKSGTTY